MKRINSFLLCDEISPDNVSHNFRISKNVLNATPFKPFCRIYAFCIHILPSHFTAPAISVKEGTFSWGQDDRIPLRE